MSTYLEALKSRVARECEAIDREARFDAVLDENYSFASVGGPFAGLTPSEVLKICDRVAYRSGINDHANSERWAEVNGESYEARAVESVRAAFVAELKNRILEIESETEASGDVLEREASAVTIEELRAAVREVSRQTF